MYKKGFIGVSFLYPIVVTGIMAVFLSIGKKDLFLNKMKLDTSESIFDSVVCDCKSINTTLKNMGEKIEDIEKKIEEIKNKEVIVSSVSMSTSKVKEFSSIKNDYYLLFSDTTESMDTINGVTIILDKKVGQNRILFVQATGNKITMTNEYYYAKVTN